MQLILTNSMAAHGRLPKTQTICFVYSAKDRSGLKYKTLCPTKNDALHLNTGLEEREIKNEFFKMLQLLCGRLRFLSQSVAKSAPSYLYISNLHVLFPNLICFPEVIEF